MQEPKIGVCTNAADKCSHARSKTLVSVPYGQVFNCPECGAQLEEVKQKAAGSGVHWGYGVLAGSLGTALIAAGVWAFWPGSGEPNADNDASGRDLVQETRARQLADSLLESGMTSADIAMYRKEIETLRAEVEELRAVRESFEKKLERAQKIGDARLKASYEAKISALDRKLNERQEQIFAYEQRISELEYVLQEERERHKVEIKQVRQLLEQEVEARQEAEEQRDVVVKKQKEREEKNDFVRASNFDLIGLDKNGQPLKEKHQRKANKIEAFQLAFNLKSNERNKTIGSLEGMKVELSGPQGNLLPGSPIPLSGMVEGGNRPITTRKLDVPELAEGQYTIKVYDRKGNICGQQSYSLSKGGLAKFVDKIF